MSRKSNKSDQSKKSKKSKNSRKSQRAKKAKKKKQSETQSVQQTANSANRVDPKSLESPRAVASTVAWLLATLATALGLVAAFVAQVIHLRNQESNAQSFVQLFLFAASVTGLVALTFTPIVKRVRRIPAPRNVTIAAIVIGATPFVVQIARSVVGN